MYIEKLKPRSDKHNPVSVWNFIYTEKKETWSQAVIEFDTDRTGAWCLGVASYLCLEVLTLGSIALLMNRWLIALGGSMWGVSAFTLACCLADAAEIEEKQSYGMM